MSSRMRRPETVRLEISRGDWLLVKKHLTAGEYLEMVGRYVATVIDANGDGLSRIDPTRVGLSKVVAYLLDWSITDINNNPVVVSDQPCNVVESALKGLDEDSWIEILKAVEAHESTSRDARKNEQSGETKPLAISTSAA